ncbi:MAG TPA: UDP-N-acetylglucosamine 2-epimerase (non-hydrolyzing) [Candidatus Methanoculleus thermohydrogenotrophicum]|mgnify:CR=1 FL=1|jgi:UDP-N-acetylglucosamine 2-epimerase (non-hydrolysing)|nr:UDP-N-acetylglucosamine 2-epimerase (non-hydrolyzing) [Candidatus Methanoculleus thermohydrogenotrophicum]NLM82068.1 UDP-N-acetylglucosamine 2-epimerase (non-hydrolyzing) [Candidatus Methanoculleus thermohydrogenotrophicum]HOB18705.1 UDP-N-acetylglucosamine 2-epimerase (non-hydrolyzing) [Candidatus Methanoculleus thermohydrogenotrophicum]HPZ38775.1 UDP-N-acetylglucosamine 2-epimerase (non-hydrolyzing) [Candidatus Methanoculleus thermohydrogenotrophicum]
MIGIILGTRPEIIKMSPVIRECERRGLDYFILHTGQHYSYEMDRLFFEELELPDPDYNLDVGSGTHAGQTAKIMTGVEDVLAKESPDIVLVQGDTNTVMAGALAASKLHMRVGHVEAGLRSFNRQMPEEINRVVTDHISDYLFAPTENARKNLLAEGIADKKICVTGNTIVDAVYQNLDIAKKKGNVLKDLDLEPREYFLVTAHRQENVDNRARLKEIMKGLHEVQKEFSLPVVFPVHPRTEKRINELGVGVDGLNLTKPFGFLEFLQLESQAKLVLTDSGGVQEETCVLGVPCATMRYDTERPETLDVGSNILVGADAERILEGVRLATARTRTWENPYGDGIAGKMIVMVCAATRAQ